MISEKSGNKGNDVDPVKNLFDLIQNGGAISAMSESPVAGNGLGYCFVIVKAASGTEYSIQAFDENAYRLHEHANSVKKKESAEKN